LVDLVERLLRLKLLTIKQIFLKKMVYLVKEYLDQLIIMNVLVENTKVIDMMV
jgi:hypothetical protein